MTIGDLDDWIAVVNADEALTRIEFQNDLRYATPFSKKDVWNIRMERRNLFRRYETLMMLSQEQQGSGWDAIKKMGGRRSSMIGKK